jgi:hypothetical protein
VLRATQHLLAIVALIFGCVVGPETHVHPGEGPHSEALVHAHAGIVGHTHGDRHGLSSACEGPASYINAFSLTQSGTLHLPAPANIAEILPLSGLRVAAMRIFLWTFPSSHAPPGVEFRQLRAPPFSLPV